MVKVEQITVTCDASGNGEAISDRPINGEVAAVHVIPADGEAATLDITVRTEAMNQGIDRITLLARNNNANPIQSPLKHQVIGADGANIANEYEHPCINDYVGLVVTGGTNGNEVKAFVFYR